MKKVIYFFIFLIPVLVSAKQCGAKSPPISPAWQNVGNAGLSASEAMYISLAISPSGQPYVAYMDFENSDKATVMRFDGNSWINVGIPGFSAGRVHYLSLAFSPSGQPYIAFSDYTYTWRAVVMKFDGNSWINVGTPGFSAHVANFLSLAFNPTGEPYLAYMDRGNADKATVMKFDGTNWVYVGNAGFSTGIVANTSLAFNPLGEPHVAYEDDSPVTAGRATVMKFDGSNWVTIGNAGFSAGMAAGTSLVINPSGQPFVAFQDRGNGGKATVMKFDENEWVTVGNAGFTNDMATETSLALSPDGEPFLAFMDYGTPDWRATVMRFDGTSWVTVGDAGFSAGHVLYLCLAFSPSGQPYVAYEDYGNSLKATVMKYDSTFTGINDHQPSQFSLYPNPAASQLTIDLKKFIGIVDHIEITDIMGMKMTEVQSSERKIILDIKSYPVGIYFVRLKMDDSVFIGKFYKK